MISFDDTEIAFAGKSDKDLQWSYRLFRMIRKPWVVRMGKHLIRFAFAIRLPIKGMIKKTIFKQFCGGEFIDDCNEKIADLGKFNIGTILDYSVEGKNKEEDLDRTRDEIIATIKKSKGNKNIPFTVFKPTGLCSDEILEKANDPSNELTKDEKERLGRAIDRIEAICKTAYELDIPVFIDAEDSWFQDAIDGISTDMMHHYNTEKAIVFNTVQMYRHDRLEFLKKSYELAKEDGYYLGIKLVRGAYMEKERARAEERGYLSPIQPNKEATDRDYNTALKFMIDHIDRIAICAGTHNEKSSSYLTELMNEKGLENNDNRIWFAQLLGMSDHISYNLAHHGYNVAKYVPYGPVEDVMPYLMRRAEENTSVAGQTGRELSLIVRERKRRKKG